MNVETYKREITLFYQRLKEKQLKHVNIAIYIQRNLILKAKIIYILCNYLCLV